MTQRTEFEQLIMNYIREHEAVTFVQLMDDLRTRFTTKGDRVIELSPNRIAWAGLSECLATALASLVRENVVALDPVDPLIYLVDGASLDLPLANRPPKSGYRKPHWVPVVLRLAM